MRRYSGVIVAVFGVANFLFAVRGGSFVYETVRNYHRATTRLSNPVPVTHNFVVVFFTMTSINVVFLALLICAGVLLLRFRRSGITFCISVFAGELIYFLGEGPVGPIDSQWSQALAGAQGVGNMGLAPQIVTGYPLIGLIILILVRRSLRGEVMVPAEGAPFRF
jgi:hypothetical protein